ncbi:alpha/beta fold hydrolase [Cohnella kolymensis]|uniref:alpha/beta fold hydrolase n=1 Tax=Cohnella kolymensis TaxID=1590652 RepID=UPI00126A61A1|nr:alpha/beta hydrolase [Cohnella kolymensis]
MSYQWPSTLSGIVFGYFEWNTKEIGQANQKSELEVPVMPLIHANGVELHYHLQGKGTSVIFVHPPCIASRVFTYVRNDLSQDHRTLLFDFRGHGRSASSATPITIPLLAEDIRQLMDVLDIPSAYLCGYSLGSMVVLHALLTYPQRFRGGILLGGLAEVNTVKTRAKINAFLAAGTLRAQRFMSFPIAWANADNYQTYKRLRSETRSGDRAKWMEYMRSGLHYSVKDRLEDIRQPVLLICGERDREYKAYMRELQQGLPNDSSAFMPGVRHILPAFGAGPVSELIRGWVDAQEERSSDAEETLREGHEPDRLDFPYWEQQDGDQPHTHL